MRRGAVELQLPDQEVEPDGRGGWRLVLRPRTDVDAWNAEISLLTGMAAARLMLDAGVGVLRTLPAADDGAVRWLRRSARSLGIAWPKGTDAAQLLAGLDPARPEALALFMDATRLLRGAAYTVFDGAPPELATHAGIAASYAHVTAPLRRLVDRFATEICLALSRGRAGAGVGARGAAAAARPDGGFRRARGEGRQGVPGPGRGVGARQPRRATSSTRSSCARRAARPRCSSPTRR